MCNEVNIILGEFKFEIKEDYCDEKGKIYQNNNKNKKIKLFEVERIKNDNVGQKIKTFSKFFFELQIILYLIIAIVFIVGLIADASNISLFIFFVIMLGLGLCFIISYYLFLIIFGFGSMVENVNVIKNNLKK